MTGSGMRILVASVLLAGMTAAKKAEAFQVYDSIWVLGDSLSDDGNLFRNCTGGTEPPADLGYREGRFSDGELWVEHLAANSGLDTGDADEYANFAYGGAYASLFNRGIPVDNSEPVTCSGETGVLAQAAEASVSGIGKEGLVTLLVGANDYFAWLQAGDPSIRAPMRCMEEGISPFDEDGDVSPAQVAACTALVVGDIADAISQIHAGGVRHFIVGNLPHLGDTPGGRGQGEAAASLLNGITDAHNAALAVAVEELRSRLDDVRITLLDLSTLFSALLENPGDYGFVNTTVPCLAPGSAGGRVATGACVEGSSNGTLFFDSIHPTARAHELTAVYAAGTLAADAVLSGFIRDRQSEINRFALRILGSYVRLGGLPLHLLLRRWGFERKG